MYFGSDNWGPAHPNIIEAITRANQGYAPSYGGDALTAKAEEKVREVFEAPDAAVFLIASGTATNALVLATLVDPWSEIYSAHASHIREDECNAVEFYSGGARITYVGHDDRIDPDSLDDAIAGATPHAHHNAQPGAVSIGQVTDLGGVYSIDEVKAISAVARKHALPLHMDGARLANALAASGATPAEMTWKAGVDAVSFGGTKNGCIGVEAAIFFDPGHAREFQLRQKRAGHLESKHRFLAAQIEAYLDDGHWLKTARAANAAAARLFAGLRKAGGEFAHPADANIAFVRLPRSVHRRAVEGGAFYEVIGELDTGPKDEMLPSRFVCDWSLDHAEIDRFLDLIKG